MMPRPVMLVFIQGKLNSGYSKRARQRRRLSRKSKRGKNASGEPRQPAICERCIRDVRGTLESSKKGWRLQQKLPTTNPGNPEWLSTSPLPFRRIQK